MYLGFHDRIVPVAARALVVVAMVFLASACSRTTPACDGEKTIEAVIEASMEIMKKDLTGMTGVQAGMELSEDEWKLMRVSMVVKVDNIRQTGKNGESYRCAAYLVIQQSGGRDSIPITYTSVLSAAGALEVEVQGL
jgi:hypothetical protein